MVLNPQGLGAHLTCLESGLHRIICFCGSSAGCIPFFLRPHVSLLRPALWLVVCKHVAQNASKCRSTKGSAQTLLADSTWRFFSSLRHESLCLESSQEGLIWLMILSLELGTLVSNKPRRLRFGGDKPYRAHIVLGSGSRCSTCQPSGLGELIHGASVSSFTISFRFVISIM